MPFTNLQIINLGLAKIGASRIIRIDPPQSSLERHCAAGYPMWKRSELGKRRWVFALEEGVQLTQNAPPNTKLPRPYRYGLPAQCIRPVRDSRTEWQQRGRNVFSACSELYITFIRDAAEAEFDDMFVDVLAWRIAAECVEFTTQSNTKKADTATLYKEAVAEAGKANAFTIGPEDIGADDSDFSYISARF